MRGLIPHLRLTDQAAVGDEDVSDLHQGLFHAEKLL